MRRRWITLRANAKLNLCLEVLRRRPDGYHDLATVFQAISLGDTVRLELRNEGKGVRVVSDGWLVPQGPANLCWRAVRQFIAALGGTGRQETLGTLGSLAIRLVKRVPPGGGLGGGSSDAAAVLVGLNNLLGNPLSAQELLAAAASIGSDVAFFASGASAALARGRGEQIEPLPSAEGFRAVVAWPGAPVSTAWAYGRLSSADFSSGEAAEGLAQAMREGRSRPWLANRRNAFVRPIAEAREDIRRLLHMLAAMGGQPVSLAGSGACAWACFPDEDAAGAAASHLLRAGLWACTVSSARRGVEIADVSE